MEKERVPRGQNIVVDGAEGGVRVHPSGPVKEMGVFALSNSSVTDCLMNKPIDR